MVRCEDCDREFSSNEALKMHNQTKHPENIKKLVVSSKHKKKIKMWASIFVSLLIIIGLIYLLLSSVKILPPTTMDGHIEVNPPSHILKNPMNLAVHKHMLEHADGVEGGRPGVIINYNCIGFECEPGLIEKLEQFAIKYPIHVYVAPFPKMDAKIVLTTLNRQKVLREYDENAIDSFVS